MKTRALPSAFGAASLLVLLAGCGSTPEKVEIDESGAPSAGVRVLLPLGRAERLRALHAGDRERARGWHHAVAIELDGTSDEAEQFIGVGETVELGDVSLSGPGSVLYDYDLASLNLSFVNGMVLADGYMFDIAAGLNSTLFKLEAERGGAHETLRAESLGPQVGLWLGWISPHRFSFRARAAYSAEITLDSDKDTVETRTIEFGFKSPLGRWAALDLGWRWKKYDSDRSGSDIELDLDGPFVSLGIEQY